MLFERDEIKFAICLLPSGSIIPAISLSASINKISSISGDSIVASSKKRPVAPTAFFIKLDESKIIPMPSLIYEPKIGIYDFIAYLAVLIEIPSTEPAAMPCIDKNAVKTVNIKPVSHLNVLLKKDVNLSSFTLFERLETTLNTTENIKIGSNI